jgi:hypothetical protein
MFDVSWLFSDFGRRWCPGSWGSLVAWGVGEF